MRMEYVRATQIAASIGQAMAIIFAFVAMFSNPFLLLIALLVWLGAAQEASMVQMRTALSGIPVMRAMVKNFHSLNRMTRSAALEYVLAGFQSDFPVVQGNRLVGVLTRNDLAAAMAKHGPDVAVSKVMQRDFVTTDPREMLHSAFMKLQECGCHTLPVVEDGRLLGLVTTDHLTEVLMIGEALRDPHARHPTSERRPDGVPLRDGQEVDRAERTPQIAGAKLWSAGGAG